MRISEALTREWQTREEIERKMGGACTNLLTWLCDQGKVLHTIDASQEPWVHKYAKPPSSVDVWIGKTHVGRLAAPVWEAAE